MNQLILFQLKNTRIRVQLYATQTVSNRFYLLVLRCLFLFVSFHATIHWHVSILSYNYWNGKMPYQTVAVYDIVYHTIHKIPYCGSHLISYSKQKHTRARHTSRTYSLNHFKWNIRCLCGATYIRSNENAAYVSDAKANFPKT